MIRAASWFAHHVFHALIIDASLRLVEDSLYLLDRLGHVIVGDSRVGSEPAEQLEEIVDMFVLSGLVMAP